jgi:hypothetical protein
MSILGVLFCDRVVEGWLSDTDIDRGAYISLRGEEFAFEDLRTAEKETTS